MFQLGFVARRTFVCAIAFVAALCSTGQSYGQTFNWNNPAGGTWSVGGNWAGGVPPSGTTTSLVFGTAATQTSTYTATNDLLGNPLSNLTNITINNTSGAVTLAGNQFSFTSPTSSITIASAGNLIINNTVVFAHAADALTVGGTGTGNVNIASISGGANSLIMNAASGSLTLSGGGTFTQMSLRGGNTFFTGGTRSLTNATNGDNSSSGLQLGNASGQTASATISNGAHVNVSENVYIGDAADSTGTLTVTGAGSQLNVTGGASSRLGVGNGGNGTLNILNGGVVNAGRLLTPRQAGATSAILVDGAGSTLHVTTLAAIASNGPGDVTIQNGGLFQIDAGAGALTMGANAPGSGTLTVNGAGSTVNVGSGLTMGGVAGTGTFGVVVQNGGSFTTGDTILMSPGAGVTSNVSVTGTGSTLTTPQSLVIAGTGVGGTAGGTGNVSVGSGGSISVTVGTSLFELGTININSGGSFSTGNIADGNGTSFGAVNLAAGTTLNLTGGLGTSDGTFSGLIAGAGGIAKSGTSLQTFAGANTYSGGTTINGGTLIITNSDALGTGSIAVGSGATLNSTAVALTVPTNATLSGAGTVIAGLGLTVNPNATIRGGASGTTDTLTITGDLSAVASSGAAEKSQITVNDTTASLIQVSGIVNFLSDGSAPYGINIQNGGGLTYNTPYTRTVVSAAGGFFVNGVGPLPAGTTISSSDYVVTSDFASVTGLSLTVGGTGDLLQLTFTPVPEPGTVLGIAAAAMGLICLRRRVMRIA